MLFCEEVEVSANREEAFRTQIQPIIRFSHFPASPPYLWLCGSQWLLPLCHEWKRDEGFELKDEDGICLQLFPSAGLCWAGSCWFWSWFCWCERADDPFSMGSNPVSSLKIQLEHPQVQGSPFVFSFDQDLLALPWSTRREAAQGRRRRSFLVHRSALLVLPTTGSQWHIKQLFTLFWPHRSASWETELTQ